MHVTTEFLVTSLVVVLLPGTGVLYTVSTGLFAGRRAGALAAAGSTLGIVPHLVAATLGLSAVLHAGARAFEVLRLAGVAYLLWLAVGTWRATGVLSLRDEGQAARSDRAVVVRGAAINLLNPKLTIFFVAFLPQFVDGRSSTNVQMVGLSVIFMAMTLAVFLVYGALASRVRDRVVGSPAVLRRLRRGFAGVFAVAGVRLALDGRS